MSLPQAPRGEPHTIELSSPPQQTPPQEADSKDILFDMEKTKFGDAMLSEETGPLTQSDPARTRAILRKIDFRILPITVLLYGMSFIDRAAIGNARAVGLMKDLDLTDGEYQLDVSIFFVAYVLCDVPSNIGLRHFGSRPWLAGIAFCWGVCQLCTAFAQSHASLAVVRTLMGVFEAGILSGISTTMSYVYPASTIQSRLGALIAFNVLFGCLAGLLAYAVAHVQSESFEGWRWLFVIEGIFTILASLASYLVLISSLDEVRFLSEEDKAYLKDRIQWDRGRREVVETGPLRREHILLAFKDVKVWLSALSLFGISAPSYTIGLALPSLLKMKLHYSIFNSQLLTIPVYFGGACVILVTSWLSDRYTQRALVLILSALASAVGWTIGLASSHIGVQFFALVLAFSGSASALPASIAFPSQNLAGRTKRAAGLAIVISVGGTASIVAANNAPNKDAPRFALAYKTNIGLCCVSIVATLLNVLWLHMANKAKAEKRKVLEQKGGHELEEHQSVLDDSSVFFTYRF